MADSKAQVHMAIDFIPGIKVGFLPDVSAGRPCGMANDRAARGVVQRVRSANQPKVEPLSRHGPAVVGLDSNAGANRLYFSPAELIGDPETVVRGGVHGVEGAMHAVVGILVARGVVILAENARLPVNRREAVSKTVGSAPSLDVIGPVRPGLADAFQRVIEIVEEEALIAKSREFLVFLS